MKKAKFCQKTQKSVISGPRGVGGENHTCRQIDPNTYNKTS